MYNLVEQQYYIEERMLLEATSRQNKENTGSSKRGEWSTSKAGSYLVSTLLSDRDTTEHTSFVTLLKTYLGDKAGVGRHKLAAKSLNECGLQTEVIAYLTAKAIFNAFAFNQGGVSSLGRNSRIKRSTLSMRVADMVHDEWRVRFFQDGDKRKALLKKLMKDFDKRTYPREWRKRTIKNYFDAEQISWTAWSEADKVRIGYALVCLFQQSTNWIEKDDSYVWMTEEMVQYIQRLVQRQTCYFTLYHPMVVPPKPWSVTNLFRGGYHTNKVKRYPIIKGATKRDVERMSNMDWSRIIPAVNAIQETPWRINKQMYTAEEWAYYTFGGSIGKLPSCDEEPMPPIPHDYETNEEVHKTYRLACFEVHDRRRRSKSNRIAAVMTFAYAKQYLEYERIYFPHNLDSRGRAYPLPAFLNPQGPDYSKALLEFAEGQPVDTPEALAWVAIAGANAYGNDKVSLEERHRWVLDNEEMILSCANHYDEDRRWMAAAEPFQFLRFCLEWKQYKEEGLGYVSHMVIPVDATNSGLQHYSAMLRDEVGGRSVNLIPGLSRQDIYGDVAKHVVKQLEEDGSQLAKDWLAFGIDRKMTKRQVMVVPYAGKFSSCLSYTREAFDEKLAAGKVSPWDHRGEDHSSRIVMLAKMIWQAIGDVVVKGKEAMQWLSKIASAYSKQANTSNRRGYDKRMSWTTPDGFEVVHFREDYKLRRVKTSFDGIVFLSFLEANGKLSPKDMALAVAPNFVHALDATHMRATIMKGLDIGMSSYGMVHDSFGVHARFMPIFLRDCVKPAFVEMYQTDVLAEFAGKFSDMSEIPPKPEMGTLDLQGVLKSEFFFS